MATAVVASQASKVAFRKVWRILGKPMLKIIKPIDEWTLPGGVLYDRRLDHFVDANGDEVQIDYKAQNGVQLPFIPQPTSNRLTLTVVGMTTTKQPAVTFLWDAKTEALLRGAWGAVLDGETYHIGTITIIPPGTKEPVEINVELRETGRG